MKEQLAQRIASMEAVVDSLVDPPFHVRYFLAHARSEWAMGNFAVAERDLDSLSVRLDELASTTSANS